MDPLPVFRSFGKLPNAILRQLEPGRYRNFLAGKFLQRSRIFHDASRQRTQPSENERLSHRTGQRVIDTALSFSSFRSSHLAIDSTWTSSGPSANRSERTFAQAAARKVFWETPAAPCAWMARSNTCKAVRGATTLIIAISVRASLLPTVSIMKAALSV